MGKNKVIITALTLVLVAVVYLTLDLHWSSQRQTLALFQRHQLLAARQLARETEWHLEGLFRSLRTLAECPFVRNFEPGEARNELEVCFRNLQANQVGEISISNATGETICSTAVRLSARDSVDARTLAWAAQPGNRGKISASIVLDSDRKDPNHKLLRLALTTPVYGQPVRRSGAESAGNFAGTVSLKVDLENLFGKHLDLVDVGAQAQAWVMARDGTLLFHSEHPEMTLRNVAHMEAGCNKCHVSMDYLNTILMQEQGTADYRIRQFPHKLAAFVPLRFADQDWIVVVNSPYDIVTAVESGNLREALLLLAATFFVLGGGSVFVYRNHHLKVQAEAESRRWRETRALEDKIRESEERYRTIVETTHDVIWTVDTGGNFTYLNSSGEKTSGYRRSDLVGKSIDSVVCEGDRSRVREILQAALSGKPQTYEFQARNASGSVFVLLTNSVPQYQGNNIVGAVSVGRDITERKTVEQKLRESQQKYETLVNSIEGIVWEADAVTHRYTFVSKPAERILGYPLAQWILEPSFWLDHLHPDDRAEAASQVLAARGKDPVFEYRMITADGRTVWFRDVARIVPGDGVPAKMRGIMVDVTERKQAEEILRLSEERFRKMFEEGPLGMAIVGLDFHFIKVNAMLCKMVGYTEQELAGRTFMDITHPGELDTDLPQVQKLKCGELSSYRREKRYLTKHGEVLWGFLTSTVIRDAKGAPLYFLSVIEDISERKRKEEALVKAEEQLRQAQKMEAVGKLAGGVAHDFNNLLTVINGYSELALSGLTESDPLHSDVVEIRKAGNRAAALTSQLLAFARKQILRPRVLRLNAVLTEMNRMLHRVMGEDIELITRLDPNLGCIKADPSQIELVILNLVINARDAMPAGGQLILSTQNVELDAASARLQPGMALGAYVLFEVTDTGHGMDQETLAHIFEPFFTTKEVGGGTGLGLSTAYGIIRQSNGYIWASSEIGQGSTFCVCLPRVENQQDDAAESDDQSENLYAESCTETILLVEDEEVVRDLAFRILKSEGYTVLAAADSTAALSISDTHAGMIDLMLTDLVLPGINGRGLADRLASVRPSMKVIFMSGYTEDRILRQGLSARSTWFIQKPFTPKALMQKVRDALDGRATEPISRLQ